MQLQYINNRTTSKAEARAFKACEGPTRTQFMWLPEATWKKVVRLAANGYTIGRVGKKTEFVFLDIDGGNASHEDLEKALKDMPDTVILPSTSGAWNKHHILIRIPEFELPDEDASVPRIQRASVAQSGFRELVQSLFEKVQSLLPGKTLELDPASGYWWQALYSASDVDDASPDGVAVRGSIPVKGWTKKYGEPEAVFRYVPSCPFQINAVFGKEPREGYRIEWDRYRYVARDGKIVREINTIPEGNRGKSIDRLCMAKVYNAVYLNGLYGASFTVDDAIKSVYADIRFQFEGGKEFLAEKKEAAQKACRMYWSEIGRKGLVKFAEDAKTVLNTQIKDGYLPRTHVAADMFKAHEEEFAACLDAESARDLSYRITEGDVKAAYPLMQKWRKMKGLVRRHGETPDEWTELIKDGNVSFPKRLQHNPKFRKFLKEHCVLRCNWVS